MSAAEFHRVKPRSPRDQDVHIVRRTHRQSRQRLWFVLYLGEVLSWWKLQRDAMKDGKQLATAFQCDRVLHGVDGRIRQKDSFGQDSRRRKG